MPQLRCKCQHIFDVTEENEIVECPVCGKKYINPFYGKGDCQDAYSREPEYDLAGRMASSGTAAKTDTPLSIVSGLSKSVIMLILAITVTVTTVFSIIDLIPHLKGFLMYVNIAKIILYVVLCLGVWQIFITNKTNRRSLSGYKCVNFYIAFIYTIVTLISIAVLGIIFFIFGIASEVAGEIQITEGMTLNTVLILVIFGVIGVIAVMSTFFTSIKNVLASAQKVMQNQPVVRSQSYLAAIILIIIGIVRLIMLIMTNTVASLLDTVFAHISEFEGIGAIITKILGGASFESNWSSILLGICAMLNYILGGVLLIIYSKRMKATQMESMYINPV